MLWSLHIKVIETFKLIKLITFLFKIHQLLLNELTEREGSESQLDCKVKKQQPESLSHVRNVTMI